MPRRGLGLALLVLVVLGSAHAAGAHPRPMPEPVPGVAETGEPGLPDVVLVAGTPAPAPAVFWLAVVAIATFVIACRRSPRRAAALVVGALLAVLAFETGLHSVHHLGDPETGCAVAVTSPHVEGVAVATVDVVPAPLAASDSPAVAERGALPDRQFRPDEGRAPPA